MEGTASGTTSGTGQTVVVRLKTVAGRSLSVTTPVTAYVRDLKEQISDEHEYERKGIKLVSGGQVLDDDKLISEYADLGDKFAVLIAKKRAVGATAPNTAKAHEASPPRKAPLNDADMQAQIEGQVERGEAPSGPLSPSQLVGLKNMERLLEDRGASMDMREFAEMLRYHGTVTYMRSLVQVDQEQLKPLLIQIHCHAPVLLTAINKHQEEFLAILNEPLPRRDSVATDDVHYSDDYDDMAAYAAVQTLNAEDEAAIGRLVGMGFHQDAATEAYLMCRNENLAASYLLDTAGGGYMQEEDSVPILTDDGSAPRNGSSEDGSNQTDDPAQTPTDESDTTAESQTPTAQPQYTPVAADPPHVAFAKLQQALVGQGKYEEALVVAEQARVDANSGDGEPDALYRRLRSLPLKEMGVTSTTTSASASASALASQALVGGDESSSSVEEFGWGISDIRRIVRRANSTLVFYSLIHHASKLYIWVVPKNERRKVEFKQVHVDLQGLEGSLVTLRRSLLRNSGINPRNVWRRILLDLYKVLIDPIADKLPNNGNEIVHVVPCSPLSLLPFHALMPADNTFLIQRHTIVMSPSIHVLAAAMHYADGGVATHHQYYTAATQEDLESKIGGGGGNDFGVGVLILSALAQVTKTPLQQSDIHTIVRSFFARGAHSILLPLFALKRGTEEPLDTTLNLIYDEILKKGAHKAVAVRQAMLRAIENPAIDIWSWANWCLIGDAGALPDTSACCPSPSSVPRGVPTAPAKARSSRPEASAAAARRQQRGATSRTGSLADFKYLKEKRIHVLYEQLVRTLLHEQPRDAGRFMADYVETNQTSIKALTQGPPPGSASVGAAVGGGEGGVGVLGKSSSGALTPSKGGSGKAVVRQQQAESSSAAQSGGGSEDERFQNTTHASEAATTQQLKPALSGESAAE